MTRRGARQDQLFEIATRLFKEKGYHNTSMQDLAEALGVQKASLYYYIESKQDLLYSLFERANSILGGQIDEIYASDLSPTEKLGQVLANHAVAIMDHLNLIAVYLHEHRSLPAQQLEQVLTTREHYEKVLTQIIQDGIASGEFRPVNVKMAVFGLLGMLNWTLQWFSPDGELSSRQVADVLTDLALYGLVKRNE